MDLLISIAVTAMVLLLVIVILSKTKSAYYRPEAADVQRLLEWVLLGQATENDWRVFCDIPIRHDDFLESIRIRCIEIEEDHFLGDDHRYLFSKDGLVKIRELLDVVTASSQN